MNEFSIVKSEMPKRDSILMAVFDVVFYNVGIVDPLYLFLLLVGATHLEGIGADCEV